MLNAIRWPKVKSLKNDICGFCDYVRAHEQDALAEWGVRTGGGSPQHNNNNNYIIYINKMSGGSVAHRGIA